MKTVYIELKNGEMRVCRLEGTFRHCQEVLYVVYGRLNIARIQFCLDGGKLADSPYLVNELEAYR